MRWRYQYGLGVARERFLGVLPSCPWTGFVLDDILIQAMRDAVWETDATPRTVAEAVQRKAEQCWEEEMAYAMGEEAFLDTAEANGWEYLEDGSRY